MRILALALFAVTIALGAASPALAQPSSADKETARNLMKEGDDKFAARDYAAAVKAYQAAHTIMHLPTTGLALAKAQIERGLLVEARDTLLDVGRIPKEPNELGLIGKARDEAAALATKVADRIPSVTITVDGPPTGAAIDISLDGEPLPATTLGVPRKTNPGQHVIAAAAAGFKAATKTIALKEGDQEKVVFALVAGSGGALAGVSKIHVESPDTPGNVIVDGKAVGATPLVVPVTVGQHKVEIEYPGGSRDDRTVDVGAGATVDLRFSSSPMDALARHRRGLHWGFSAAPSMLLFIDGGTPLYGGTGSFVLHVGITPLFDFRTGLRAGGFHRGDMGNNATEIVAVVPLMLGVNYSPWFSASAGLSGGFFFLKGANDNPATTAPVVGPEWSVLTMCAGDKRQFELSFVQGLRFGKIPLPEYHQSLAFTYLFLD